METRTTPRHARKTRMEPFCGHSSHRAPQGKLGSVLVNTPCLLKDVFQRIVQFRRDQCSRRWRRAGEFYGTVPLVHEINGAQSPWIKAGAAAPISLPPLSGQAGRRLCSLVTVHILHGASAAACPAVISYNGSVCEKGCLALFPGGDEKQLLCSNTVLTLTIMKWVINCFALMRPCVYCLQNYYTLHTR